MAGQFPGARNVAEFWHNLTHGIKSIRTLSDEELLAAGVNRDLLTDSNYVKKIASLEDIDLFDAPFFGFSPRDAQTLDPQTRVFLQCTWETLEDAGYASETYDGLIGVFAGKGSPNYMRHSLATNPDFIQLVGELQTAILNENDSLAPIVAYKLDLKGPSISVQSFCSTSLLAVHLACQSLLAYECDLGLAGGAAITIPHGLGYLFQEGGILSPDGECRSFDAHANGSIIGSGVGVVALKRLRDALDNGDHIYAVIRGSATNNDGMLRVGYTAPGLNGQAAVILEALSAAEINPETVSYVQTHGTGTPLGDSIELEAMIQAFSTHTNNTGFCAIGSIKPNVGHLDRASGIANLIATALALHHKQLPPSLNFEKASPDIDLATTPFYVNTKRQDWKSIGRSPRRAGVSSFGLGGTNVHLVLEEAPSPQPSSSSRPYQLLLLSAKTEGALEIATSNLVDTLVSGTDEKIADVAFTLQLGRMAFNHRRMVVCRDPRDGANALTMADPHRVFSVNQTHRERPVAFMFPGVGDHYVGMGFGLYQSEPTFRKWVDECSALLMPHLHCDLRSVIYPQDYEPRPAAHDGQDRLRLILARQEENTPLDADPLLERTLFAQSAVFVVEYALAQLLMEWGLRPKALIGFSLGEYTAACVAGVLSLEDALTLVAKRAQLIETLQSGRMLTVALPEAQITSYLNAHISLAAVPTSATCVLAGPGAAIDELNKRLTAQGIAYRLLPTSHAFHSRMMEPIAAGLELLLRNVRLNPLQIPYVSNLTGRWITECEVRDPTYWVKHLCHPVRFADGIGTLLQEQNQLVMEVGPGRSLSFFARQHPDCDDAKGAVILPTLRYRYDDQSDTAFLLTTLGKTWLAGAPVDWSGVYSHETRSRLSLPTYPFERHRYWIDAKSSSTESAPLFKQQSGDKKSNIRDWFYLPTWKQTRLRRQPNRAPSVDKGGTWLFFMDNIGIGAQVAALQEAKGCKVVRVYPGSRFSAEGKNTYFIDPTQLEDYRNLLEVLPHGVTHVVHLWSIDSLDHDYALERFARAQRSGFYSLLFLIKALKGFSDTLSICAVTSNTESVTGSEELDPEKAPIAGVCRVIPQENLNITCQTIDIECTRDDQRRLAWLAEQIAAESVEFTDDLAIAYRGNTRWIQVVEPAPMEKPSGEVVWRQRGVYLLIGGLGEVGMCIGQHLALTAQVKLIISSRFAFPERADWEDWLAVHDESDRISRKIHEFRKWEATGAEVWVTQADAADPRQMSAVLNQIDRRFNELHGVLYAPGVSSDDFFAPVQEITVEQCEAHFQSKVRGLYVLEDLLGDRPLDFCIVFSSISSVLGGLGFAAYTAANRFIDVFTHRHNRQNSHGWTVVNWDTWRTREDLHSRMGATVAVFDMSPAEANEALERIIFNQPLSQIINSTGDVEFRIDQWVRMLSLRQAERQQDDAPALHPRPSLMGPYAPPTNETERIIVEIWQSLIGIAPIGINDNFLELGGHSLLATQVISRLRQTFRVHLPLTTLLMSPTVDEFAMVVELALIEQLEACPGDEHGAAKQPIDGRIN